jgi:hypothetical protein
MNKLFGIPPNLKFSNNDNTIYYENNLSNKSEADFQAENFDRSEMKEAIVEQQIHRDPDKQDAIKHIIETLKNKRSNKENSVGQIKQLKQISKNVRNPPILKITPSDVTVTPAFNTPLPDPVSVGPAVITESPLDKLKNLGKKAKAAHTIKKAIKARYDIKRYDASKTTATLEPHTPPPPPAADFTASPKATIAKASARKAKK